MGSSLLTHYQPLSVRDSVRLFTKYPFIKPDTYLLASLLPIPLSSIKKWHTAALAYSSVVIFLLANWPQAAEISLPRLLRMKTE